jgi:hypothetical protein
MLVALGFMPNTKDSDELRKEFVGIQAGMQRDRESIIWLFSWLEERVVSQTQIAIEREREGL